jgi:hypothetical protein
MNTILQKRIVELEAEIKTAEGMLKQNLNDVNPLELINNSIGVYGIVKNKNAFKMHLLQKVFEFFTNTNRP